MKKTVFLGAVFAGLLAFGEDVATLEAGLRTAILEKINAVNPIDSATGQRTYISFGFISDIHKCKRVSGDDVASNPVKTYWYGSAGCLTEAEQSIRLLGAVATDAGLDAVINGGDLSTAPIMGTAKGLTEEEYLAEIWNVKAMFTAHLPANVPLFTVDGNHERSYSLNGALMEMSDATWANVLADFNTSAAVAHAHDVDVTYHRDLANAKLGDAKTGRYAGNSFHLDFRRVLKNGGKNVRILCLNAYDRCEGSLYAYRTFDAGQLVNSTFEPPCAVGPENTVMGLVAHGSEEKPAGQASSVRYGAIDLQNGFMNGYANAGNKVGPWNGGNPGYGFFGLVSAHFHFTNLKDLTPNVFDGRANPDNNVYASAISVASAYADNSPGKSELGTEAAYHFSVFVIDTDRNLIREVRVGGWTSNPVAHESPVVQVHDYNIRTHLDAQTPAEPTDPTEPEEPEDDPATPDDPPDEPTPSGDGLEPSGDTTGVTDAQAIQALIDAAAAEAGTVTLGAGTFCLNAQLMVTNGVTLAGQGWKSTTLRYVGTANTADSRVATLSGGATLKGVTVTGARVGQNQYVGGAVTITGTGGATVSWCCITDNSNSNSNGGGIGVFGSGKVKIDHTIVANNSAGINVAATGGGIGMRPGATGLVIEIDACLIYGNSVGKSGSTSSGGGIGIIYKKVAEGNTDLSKVSATIRNTTIADNTVVGSGKGGGFYTSQNGVVLRNCIIADNVSATDSNVAYLDSTIAASATVSSCLVGGTTAFVDSANGDYHLSDSYADAIGKGETYTGIGVDLDNKAFAAKPSIGCYEQAGATPPPPEEPPEETGELANYKWAVIGDSLSDPTLENATDGPLKYYYYLQQTTGIKVVYTSGVGSTGYKAGSDKGKCFYQRLESRPIPADVDVVTVFGSINDAGFAETDEDLGTPTDSLSDEDTLAAYMNKAIDLIRSQAPNAKIILIGGIFFSSRHVSGHIRLNDMLSRITAVRKQNGDANIFCSDWLTENPNDPLDFHQITVNQSEEGCFASLYAYDWETRGRINESFGHPNPLYNEIWLAPHFGKVLTDALTGSSGDDPVTPPDDPPEEPSEDPEDAIKPSGDASGATDAQVIQAALDAAVSTKGTVALGKGLFMVKTQLNVAGGVTLIGQGWVNTVIKYVGPKDTTGKSRVAAVSDGSVLSHVAITGGKINKQYEHGGGVQVSGTGGTISWCCVSNNAVFCGNTCGGGIGIASTGSVKIDHTIVSGNSVEATSATYGGGGIGTRPGGNLSLEIDTCLVSGNTAGTSGSASRGAGICIVNKKLDGESATDLEKVTTVIRNTTIANNVSVGSGMGGGFYASQKKTTLLNCILSDNAAGDGDVNVAFFNDAVKSSVAEKASNCLFGNGTTAFGTDPVSGSAGFVDAAAGDYHLAKGSSAIGKGAPYDGIGNDLANKAFATPPSIGCYEYVADGKKRGFMLIFR